MTARNPAVSIVCTNYNKGQWIRDAIESFLAQKVNFDYEILIIDDKSTDESPDIIRQYQQKYPDRIRAFFNKKNLGITKTWIKICKEANGQYIARCDGDDYWTDSDKMRKQVELLDSTKNSLWCSTDVDMLTASGGLVTSSVFQSGRVNRPVDYEELLATRGFTAPSTWMIDRRLLLDVNSRIDLTAVDDTFNIQLELFQSTKLTYLPESTTVYRVDYESDSRPSDFSKIKSRSDRLLETQVEYIDKYPNVNHSKMLKIVLHELNSTTLLATNLDNTRKLNEKTIKSQANEIAKKELEISELRESVRYKVGSAIALPITSARRIFKRTTRSKY